MRPALLLLTLLPSLAAAEDWPHWRGPNRDGTTGELSRWEDGAWPPGEPAWTASVGVGGSSPLIASGRVYTLGWRDGADHLEARDAATGALAWAQSYPAPQWGRHHAMDESAYRGPSSTPEFDAETGYLYTLSLDGDLNCWDTGREGARVWGRNLIDDFAVPQRPATGGRVHDYGYTTAPLVYGDWLLVEVGAPAGNLMAFDKRTGAARWASVGTDAAGHSGGLALLEVEGIPCVAVLTLHRLVVVRLDTGHEGATLAEYPWETSFGQSIASPVPSGDSVVLTSGYSQSRTARVRITAGGAELAWEARNLYSKACTPVVRDGAVCFAWQKLRCLDWETGALRWEGGSFGDDASVLVTGDGRLIIFGHRALVLCEGPGRANAYTELSRRADVGDAASWPHVALADVRLYARDLEGTLLCFDLGR